MGRHTSGPEKAPKPTRSGPSEAPHTARSATARPQRNHPQRDRSSAHNAPKRNATQRVTQHPTPRPIADHTEQTEHKPAKSRTAHPRTSQTRVTPPHTRDDAPRSSNPRTTSTRRGNGAGEESSTSSTRIKQERQRRRTPKEIRPDGSQSHDAPVSPVDTDSKEKTPFTMWQWVLAARDRGHSDCGGCGNAVAKQLGPQRVAGAGQHQRTAREPSQRHSGDSRYRCL